MMRTCGLQKTHGRRLRSELHQALGKCKQYTSRLVAIQFTLVATQIPVQRELSRYTHLITISETTRPLECGTVIVRIALKGVGMA